MRSLVNGKVPECAQGLGNNSVAIANLRREKETSMVGYGYAANSLNLTCEYQSYL